MMRFRISARYIKPILAAALLLGAAGCKDMILQVSTRPPVPPGETTTDNAPSDASPYPEIVSTANPTCQIPQQLTKAASAIDADVIPGSYIVMLNESASFGKGVALAKGGTVYRDAVNGFAAQLTPDQVDALRSDPDVKYVEPDYRVKLDVRSESVDPATQQVISWGAVKVGGSRDGTGRTAWILDTGIDLDNLDLNIDRALSRNFIADGQVDAQDQHGHGTHVAGIIGARNNGFGVVGLAANARLIGLRVLDDTGGGSYSSIIAGIDYVVANGRSGDVMNLSLGGPASNVLDEAVRRAARKGIKVVVAAGNENASTSTTSPARVNYPGVYTVSAIDKSSRLAPFSNYGPAVDVAAPGVMVASTRVGGGAVYMSGTSMAAPHVVGLLLFGILHGNGVVVSDPDGCYDPIAYK